MAWPRLHAAHPDRQTTRFPRKIQGRETQVDIKLGGRQQCVESRSTGLLVKERLVTGVLQQPADEIGHAGDQVADRTIGPNAEPSGGELVLELVPESPENLKLEVRVRASEELVGCEGVGYRAEVVRGNRHPYPGTGDQQPASEHLEVTVTVGLRLIDRRRPPLLAGLRQLVIPVRALD